MRVVSSEPLAPPARLRNAYVRYRALHVFVSGQTRRAYETQIRAERLCAERVRGDVRHWSLSFLTDAVFRQIQIWLGSCNVHPHFIRDSNLVIVPPETLRTLLAHIRRGREKEPLYFGWDGAGTPVRCRVHDGGIRRATTTVYSVGILGAHGDMDSIPIAVHLGGETAAALLTVLGCFREAFAGLDVAVFALADGKAIHMLLSVGVYAHEAVVLGGVGSRCPWCTRSLLQLRGPCGVDRVQMRVQAAIRADAVPVPYLPASSIAERLRLPQPHLFYDDVERIRALMCVPELCHTIGHIVRRVAHKHWPALRRALEATKSGPWTIAVGDSISIKGLDVELRPLLSDRTKLVGFPEEARLLLLDMLDVYQNPAATNSDWYAIHYTVHRYVTSFPVEGGHCAYKRAVHRLAHIIDAAAVFGLPVNKFKGQGIERMHQRMNDEHWNTFGSLPASMSRVIYGVVLRCNGDVSEDGRSVNVSFPE